MAKSRLRVTQQWQRHFEAPVALLRTAYEGGDVLVADEDANLHLLSAHGDVLWSNELPFTPAALALDRTAEIAAVASQDGTVAIFNRQGGGVFWKRVVFQPTSLDLSPSGEEAVLVDGGGQVSILEIGTAHLQKLETGNRKYHYARFLAWGRTLLAVGLYGEVMLYNQSDERSWEKDFRCHTRLPSASASGELILVPSPHFGIIVLGRDGSDRGLFEVPGGPKCACVTPDGQRVFVVNEGNELIVFRRDGQLLFRQPFGTGVWHVECDEHGRAVTAGMTSGAVERFAVSELRRGRGQYLEFAIERGTAGGEGPAVLWRTKVFSALGGLRGGQLAVTPSARHVALLDVEGNLRVFDKTGILAASAERIYGLQPSLKAARTHDFVVAASSRNLLALDLRSYRQRRLAVKNEWATHFDIAPSHVFFAVADFFRGISLYDEELKRAEFFETDDDVLNIAVDGNRHTMVVMEGGALAFYSDHGSLIRRSAYPCHEVTALTALGKGFAVAAAGRADTFSSEGLPGWSVEVGGEVNSIQATRQGLVITAADGAASLTNAHGTVVARIRRRAEARYFSAPADPKEIISVEHRGRLVTARSSDKGVLWRREMDDDTTAMEISPDGAFVALLAGVYLYVLSTAAGGETPSETLYLEI